MQDGEQRGSDVGVGLLAGALLLASNAAAGPQDASSIQGRLETVRRKQQSVVSRYRKGHLERSAAKNYLLQLIEDESHILQDPELKAESLLTATEDAPEQAQGPRSGSSAAESERSARPSPEPRAKLATAASRKKDEMQAEGARHKEMQQDLQARLRRIGLEARPP